MNLKQQAIQRILVSLRNKLWLFLIIHYVFEELKGCTGMEISNELSGNNRSYSYGVDSSSSEKDNSVSGNQRYCRYFNSSNHLICKGLIDFEYLKNIQKQPVTDFIVENYEAESIYKKKYWSLNNLKTGEWYTKLPKVYQKLTGQIRLKDTGLEINVIIRLVPQQDSKGFLIDGEAFSNKVIKISWKLNGNLSLSFVKNKTVVQIDVGDSDWNLKSNLTFNSRNGDNDIDEWSAVGVIKSQYLSENQFVPYKGTIGTRMKKGECRFTGEVNVKNVNLVGTVMGSVAPPQNKQITIPKEAFSKMVVENIIFKDSVFFNDFNKNSFLGLTGVKTFTFVGSKLEVMPRLDELFQYFSDLREIYIEDCITPSLKFGSYSVLRNVQKLSLKGSGPFEFNDMSFIWLQNSSLSSLNLRNCHLKTSVKATSILWSVNITLKDLDVSYSTLTEERDMISFLRGLSIVNLKAEGLQLKKIPTNALSSVAKTLQRLSLRGNNFKKTLEKYLFDSVFNFPLMLELTELNLMECHINYLEKGAFNNLPNLKVLYIGSNHLENLQDGWTFMKPGITHLDLSHNRLTPFVPSVVSYDLGSAMNLSTLEKLEVLNLSDGIFTNTNQVIGSLRNKIKNLSLKNTGLEDLPENIFQHLTQLETLDMSFNRNIKIIQSLSFKMFRNLKNLKSLDLKHCRISSSIKFIEDFLHVENSENFLVENLEHLDLSANNIKILDSGTLKMLPKLKILNLCGNSITVWKTSLFEFNKHLEAVFLDENKIERITTDMFSDILKLKFIKLGNNPFICGSYVYEILKISESHRQFAQSNYIQFSNEVSQKNFNTIERRSNLLNAQEQRHYELIKKILQNLKNSTGYRSIYNSNVVNILDWSDDNYVCFSWSLGKFIPFSSVNENFEDYPKVIEVKQITLLWLPIVIVAGIVITLGIFFWKYLDVHLITRAVRNAVALSFLNRGESEPTKYEYNVFVSYSDKDRFWVIENLLPRLESRNEVKVCLHERDFQVGLSILENIISGIDKSKNVILVLSQSFLKSQWCQYEMHLAQHRLLEKGREQLILVFLENIPVVKRPKTLRYLMMTKTYIEWPVNTKNSKEIENFWRRLMRSLL